MGVRSGVVTESVAVFVSYGSSWNFYGASINIEGQLSAVYYGNTGIV